MEKRLARGLDALMGRAVDPKTPTAPGEIPVRAIRRNPDQPRVEFDLERIRDLAQSIQQHGLLQPIVVRAVSGGFELISGERRLRAFETLGRDSIPAIVRSMEENDRLVLALVENLQRENLNPIEEARAFHRLISEFGLTHEQVAERVGRDRSTVSNALRLLDLPEAVLEMVSRGTITAGHARTLVPIAKHPQFDRVVRAVVDSGLSVRATERLVRDLLRPATHKSDKDDPAHQESRRRTAVDDDLESRLRAKWGVVARVRTGDSGGEVTFRCSTPAEFDYLLQRLEHAQWRERAGERFSDFEID